MCRGHEGRHLKWRARLVLRSRCGALCAAERPKPCTRARRAWPRQPSARSSPSPRTTRPTLRATALWRRSSRPSRAGRFRRRSSSSRRMRRRSPLLSAPAAGARDSGVSLRNYHPNRPVHPWMLAFAHRKLFEAQLAKFDLFAYLEDDIELTWAHVVAWARDDAALARHSAATGARWSRGFYRLHRDDAGRMSRDDIFACEFNFSSWLCRIPPPAGGGGARLRQAAQPVQRGVADAAGAPRRAHQLEPVAAAAAGRQQARAARRAVVHPRVGRRRRPVSPRRGLPRLRPRHAVVPYEMTAAGPRLAADAGVRHLVPAKPCGCKLDDLRKDVFVAQCLCDGAARHARRTAGACGRRRRRRRAVSPMRRDSDVW